MRVILSFMISMVVLCIGGEAMALELLSDAFVSNEFISQKYTCQGQDISPQLHWFGVPAATRSLVLICDDPDAPMGTWVHWVVYDIPVTVTEFAEGVDQQFFEVHNIKEGMTDFGRTGYGGPCPPPGRPHRYFFKLYCLDIMLNLAPGLQKEEVEREMEGHILNQTELIGLYKR